MRVLLVNTYYYPEIIGGAEYSVKKLAENLSKKGIECAVFCTSDLDADDFVDDIKVYRRRMMNVCRALDAPRKGPLTKVRRRLQDVYCSQNERIIMEVFDIFKPDVIHTNGLYDISPIVWEVARKRKIKIVHTIRDYFLMCPNVSLTHKTTGKQCTEPKNICKLYRKINRKYSCLVDAVTAPSMITLSTLINERYFPDARNYVVPNAIDFNMTDVQSMRAIRENRHRESFQFIFLGSLEKKKGLQWLIESFRQIKDQNCKLYIAGKGSLEDFVKQSEQMDSRIHFCGFCSEQEVNQLLADSDVLVCPSIWNEPFGRVVIDAYKQCMPVIANSMGALPEIVLNEKTGLLVDSSDERSIKLAMEKFIDNKVDKQIMYKNIVDFIDEFSMNRQGERFIKIYKNQENIKKT